MSILEICWFIFILTETIIEGCDKPVSLNTGADCQAYRDFGFEISGVYIITPPGTFQGIYVYCDMETDGGGWIVVQRRQDGSENFFRYWDEYQIGFGNITGEFWLGNLFLHVITSKGSYEVRFDLEDWEGNTRFAKYSAFKVGDAAANYRLIISGYSGDAGDSMAVHNDDAFTTRDRDNDPNVDNCAVRWTGAWWYQSCHQVNINGKYNSTVISEGLVWKGFRGYTYSLKKTEMKIRRR